MSDSAQKPEEHPIMADVATPSAVAMSTMDGGAPPTPKPQKSKPEKPDEAAYKENLSQTEKAYLAAQDKFVCLKPFVNVLNGSEFLN